MKQVLALAALIAAFLLLPAPAQKLEAEIRAGQPSAALRIGFDYRLAIARLPALELHAGMTIGGERPLRFTGGIALR